MTNAFIMNVDFAIEFFERCQKAKAVTEEERSVILLQLVKENKAEYLGSTPLGKASFAKRLSKHAKVTAFFQTVKPSIQKEA